MFVLIQLALFLCSFIQAEYVLYKYDGTELSVQEHRTAYQILLEQQWPTAPAFNSAYNPELDEEIEIAKRLKAEVPTVYVEWIPRIVYESILFSIIIGAENDDLNDFISQEKIPIFYEQPFSNWFVSHKAIIQLGRDVNLQPRYIELHRLINEALRFVFKTEKQPQQELLDYYYKIILNAPVSIFSAFEEFMSDAQRVISRIILKILKLELLLKDQPNHFLLWRAGDFLPERDFSVKQLQLFEDNVAAVNANKHVVINEQHLANISYGSSFLSAVTSDPGASCFVRFFNTELSGEDNEGYLYALLMHKTDILNGIQLFGIPPLTTMISGFFSCGELFHPRAYTLLTNKGKNKEIESVLEKMTKDHCASNLCKQSELTWCDYWLTDPVTTRMSYKLDSTNEVIKQAALRRRYIVQNAIPLNDATKKIIDDARSVYK